MHWYVSCCLTAGALVGAPASAADITVRVISAKTGRPMVEKKVRLILGTRQRASESEQWGTLELLDKREYTAQDGTAVFHVGPLPSFGWVDVVDEADPDQCSPGLNPLDQVIHTGVAVWNCPHRPRKFAVSPKPFEIVIYVGEYSRWERILYLPWHT